MSQDGHDKKDATEGQTIGASLENLRAQLWNKWPTGLTAIAVIGLGWVGMYLIWQGILFITGQ